MNDHGGGLRRFSGWLRAFYLSLGLPLGLLALMSACAPHMEAAGPPVMAPEFNADYIIAADGVRLPLRLWPALGETRAVVVAVHGFNDYSNGFDGPAAYWAERGITTYAYDQRGFGQTASHGLWPGTETMVDDLRMATNLIAARHPDTPLILLGESMGGAVSMVLMAGPEPPVIDGLVLVAPAVWGWQTMNPFYKAALWLGAHTVPWFKPSGRGLQIRASNNRDMLIALSRDPYIIKYTRIDSIYGLVNLMDAAFDAAANLTTPTLIQYGAHDDLVPKKSTHDMLQRLTGPHRLAFYDTGYHMLLRDLDPDPLLADIVAWITDTDAPLPSGREGEAGQILAAE
jgi:alpha-beta hydrolase superfamily lysophospholipase